MIRRQLILPVVLVLAISAAAQRSHRDSLTGPEVDKIRDAAQEPEIRLKLYIEFARARLEKLQQARAGADNNPAKDNDNKDDSKDKAQQTREALQDFLDVYDELNTNVDTYADRGDDLRKALKPVIEADTEFGSKLRAFKSEGTSTHEDPKSYAFLLGSALEAIDESAKDHRDLLAEQEELFKHKKKQDRKESARGE
jgi:seryl-tRNA synthetase